MTNKINLGDLSKIKIDDELVTCYQYDDEILIGKTLFQVSGIDKIAGIVKVCKFGSSITRHSFNKITGKAIHYDYFFSANPLHIQEVRNKTLEKLEKSKQEFIEFEKLKSSVKEIADVLTWTDDSSNEVVVELSKRLKPDQISILKEWLGIVS